MRRAVITLLCALVLSAGLTCGLQAQFLMPGERAKVRLQQPSFLVNNQTGTTYTFKDSDRNKLVTTSNAASIAITLPQANGTTFGPSWCVWYANRGAGVATITPTTSTLDSLTSLAFKQGQGAMICSDGANYFTNRGRTKIAVNSTTASGNFTTTSGTLVDLTNMTVTFTLEEAYGACRVDVNFPVSVSVGTGQALAALNIDSSDTSLLGAWSFAGTSNVTMATLFYNAGALAAGSHTIKVRVRNSDGSSTVAISMSGVANGNLIVTCFP